MLPEMLFDLLKALRIFKKDVRLELKEKFEFFSMLTFGLSAVFIFSLSFSNVKLTDLEAEAQVISASIWVIFVFTGMLSYTSLFGREIKSDGGALNAMRSLPVKPQVIFFGKFLFNMFILCSIEVIILSLYGLFFKLTFKTNPFFVFFVFLIATSDYAIVGTLISALTIYSRAKTLVIPILMFPLIIPSVMIAVLLISNLITGILNFNFFQNLLLLVLHFLIILSVAFLTVESILRD